MRAYGSDRVRVSDDGRIHLRCRLPKHGWQARVERTLTTPEHPGTAVLWEDAYYEVLEVEQRSHGVHYVLAPWQDRHAIRVADRYDEESEAHRLAEYHSTIKRERHRKSVLIVGILAGHLPAAVQQKLASELGVFATRLTAVSAITGLIPFALCIHVAVKAVLAEQPSPVPIWLWLIAGYFVADSAIRFELAFRQNRPVGSVIGLIGYSVYWALSPNRSKLVSPLAVQKGEALYKTEAPADVAIRDSFRMREPFFTLLPSTEQVRLAERYGFDYRQHAIAIAVTLLIFSVAGIGTSMSTLRQQVTFSALLSFVLALYLAIEQIVRFQRFPRGPAGSILGLFVRPLARKFLA